MKEKFYVIAGIAALALAGCRGGGGSAGGTLANVNGDSIDYGDFYAHMGSKKQIAVQTGNGVATVPVAGTIAFQSLVDMMRQRAVLQLAKDEGLEPKPADVKAELDFRKKLDPDFVKKLRAEGFSLERINEQLEVSLAEERLVTKGITVKPEEVDTFIANNKDLFRTPATVDMLWVFAKSEDNKKKIDAELAKGGLFQTIAQQYGEQPNARTSGGRFTGPRAVNQLPVQLQQLIQKTKPGTVTKDAGSPDGWLKLSDGWAKFYVEKKTEAQDVAPDEARKEAVRRQLAMQRGQAGTNIQARVNERLMEAKVTIEDKTLKEEWERYVKALKDAKDQQGGTPTASR